MKFHPIAAVAAALAAAGCAAPQPPQRAEAAWRVEPLWRVDRGAPAPDGRGAFAQGQVLQGEGRWREAAESYRRALEENPNSPEFFAAWRDAVAMLQPQPRTRPAAAAAAFAVISEPTVPALQQQGAPAGAAVPVPRSVVPSVPALHVEVFNGNGVAGAAGRLRAHLREQGIAVDRLGNLPPYRTETTTVFYRPGRAAQARWLASRLPLSSALVPTPGASGSADVRVVVGRDATPRTPFAAHPETEQTIERRS